MRHSVKQTRQQQLLRLQQRQRMLSREQEEEEEEQDELEYRLPVINTWKQNQDSIYDDNSESASIEDDDDDDDDDARIYDQSNLTEQILDAEKKFSTSSIQTSCFTSSYLERPSVYRVLFMGSITHEEKKEIYQKLSQGFVYILHERFSQQIFLKRRVRPTPLAPFKEIKHNILLLSDEEEHELLSDTYEDIGVSLIEADFTWESNVMTYASEPDQLLLRYAAHQHDPELEGFVYPETTPNGIDLCVYFYTGDDHDRVEKDLVLLRMLRKLGIYVLPLTTTRDEYLKSHFADMLTEYKVRCLDLGNLDVGKQPSFFHPLECTSNMSPRVATYQILAIEQFCVIENRAIFQLLKKTRERPEKKVPPVTAAIVDECGIAEKPPPLEPPRVKQPMISGRWYFDYRQFLKSFVVMMVILGISAMMGSNQKQWSATLEMNIDYTFMLYTKNAKGDLDWARQDPQVWLNHEISIPIEKMIEQRGYYRLQFDVLSLDTISFEFYVNSTLPIHYTLTIPSTYILINPSISQEDRRNTNIHHELPQDVIQNTRDILSFGAKNFLTFLKFLVAD